MQNEMRLAVLMSAFTLTLACGSATDQQAVQQTEGNALTTPAPGAGPAEGTAPAARSTPGAETRAVRTPTERTVSATPLTRTAPAAPAAPKATMMEMDVPSGTELHLTLETPVSSETATVEKVVRARVARPVVISGMTVIPEGAPVTGIVVAAERAGRVKGRATLALRFDRVIVAKTPYTIDTARIVRQAEATKGEDATKIGIGAGVGTAIGAIAGGKKGAAIGAGVGGGAGAGAVLATRGKEVTIPAGATLRTTVEETVRITAPM